MVYSAVGSTNTLPGLYNTRYPEWDIPEAQGFNLAFLYIIGYNNIS